MLSRSLPGAVHEVIARLAHGLAVVDYVVKPDLRGLLACGTEGLQRDVVEPAEIVSARGIPLCRGPVVRGVSLEVLDLVQERLRGGGVADVLQHVGLRADQLVGFGQISRAAVADDLLRHPAGERVAGDAGECVRAAALEGEAERANRLRRAPGGRDLRQPAFDQRSRARDLLLEPALDAEERVRHMVERVVAVRHELLQVVVAVGARAIVGREHRARVGVHHEAREHPEHVT